MEWCIDANVAVKAVIKEDFSKNAMALISDASNMEIRLIAPISLMLKQTALFGRRYIVEKSLLNLVI